MANGRYGRGRKKLHLALAGLGKSEGLVHLETQKKKTRTSEDSSALGA